MNRYFNTGTGAVAAAFLVLAVGAGATLADGLRLRPVDDPLVARECSACHMAYPAGLLPARSWRALMGGLAEHFGDNAELDAAAAAKIADYLVANAADARGRGGRLTRGLAAEAAPLRITETPWWTRKHERKNRVAPATLKKRGAAFKGDCKACHTQAEQGVFEDD